MGKSASACLDEHDVLAFASGHLEPRRRGQALVHLDECETCRSLVAELARENVDSSGDDGGDEPPVSERPLVDGRFRLIAPLGSGAMGTVYRARDEKLGIDVALKLLRTTGDDVDRNTRAFARELTVGRRVTHPNVCRLHDAGRHGEASYITMELVEGETLADVLLREEVSEDHALEILRGVAEGLAAVHAQGIVHRDLKPANVMIARATQRPVLTDFGFAAELDSKQSRRLVGTPSFWAPEQARGEPATPASDVYSLGLVAYRLLARREFSLSDRKALVLVPRRYRPFVSACLAASPSERPRDGLAALGLLRPKRFPPSWSVAPLVAVALGGAWWLAHPSPRTPARNDVAPDEPARMSSGPAEVPSSTAAPSATGGASSSVKETSGSPVPAIAPSALRRPDNISTSRATRSLPVHRAVGGPASSGAPSSGFPAPEPTPPPEPDPLYRH